MWCRTPLIPTLGKAEARGFQWVPGQPGLCMWWEILSQNKQKQKTRGLLTERSMGNSRAAEWLKAPLSVFFKWCFPEAGSSGARRTEVGSEDLRAFRRLSKGVLAATSGLETRSPDISVSWLYHKCCAPWWPCSCQACREKMFYRSTWPKATQWLPTQVCAPFPFRVHPSIVYNSQDPK